MAKTLKKALTILQLLASKPDQPHRLGWISQQLKIHPSSCVYLLNTLVETGFVDQEGARKGYALGPMVHYLAAQGPYRQDLISAAEPVMETLAGRLQQTLVFAILHRGRRILLTVVDGNREVRIRRDNLFRDTVLDTATGRLLVAHLPDADQAAYRPDSAAFTAAQMAAIRKQGVATHEAPGSMFVQVAVPVCRDTSVIAALGVSVPRAAFTGKQKRLLIDQMQTAAGTIGDRWTAAIIGNSAETRGRSQNT
jgi:DNA-binding IclR family transcriptional regulator